MVAIVAVLTGVAETLGSSAIAAVPIFTNALLLLFMS